MNITDILVMNTQLHKGSHTQGSSTSASVKIWRVSPDAVCRTYI
jgi:hypothetical protein